MNSIDIVSQEAGPVKYVTLVVGGLLSLAGSVYIAALYLVHTRYSNKPHMLNAVGKDGLLLARASKELKDDLEVVTKATNEIPLAIQFAGERCRNDAKLARILIGRDVRVVGYLGEKLLSDQSFLDSIPRAAREWMRTNCSTQ